MNSISEIVKIEDFFDASKDSISISNSSRSPVYTPESPRLSSREYNLVSPDLSAFNREEDLDRVEDYSLDY